MKYKYFAFISYNVEDTLWGKRLQKKLEGYRMPSTMCSEHGWERKPIRPVFFAPTDIQPGMLTVELQERLKASRNLIVICSPNSARSEWVGREIEYFHSLGRTENIHFFIVEGVPNCGNEDYECFNPVVQALGIPEILGANIHDRVSRWPWINRERAYVQLVTKLLGVEFDTLWQRHQRLFMEKCVSWLLGTIAIVASLMAIWINSRPVDLRVRLNEVSVHNDNLPPLKDASVSVFLENETKTGIITSIDSSILFANIPHNAIGKETRITVHCSNWLPADTIVSLTRNVSINMARNSHTYGDIQFRLWNVSREESYPNTSIFIKEYEITADTEGRIMFTIPLSEQDTIYDISSSLQLVDTTLHMPTTESTIVEIQ